MTTEPVPSARDRAAEVIAEAIAEHHIVLLGGETEGAIVAEMRLQGVIHPDGR